jgi:aminoglycoside phosphotransferase (APT) family kinase protein
MSDPAALLDEHTAVAYLAGRGLIDPGEEATVTALGGGVSNIVLLVSTPRHRLVLKQALPRLRVEAEWLANRERAITEAAALRFVGGIDPVAVPELFDIDEERCALTLAAAPDGGATWKEDLLRGSVDDTVASRLGEILARVHAETVTLADPIFDAEEAFRQLRIDPYHRTVAERHPKLRPAIESVIDRMLSTHVCLVHGDCSPKNVLVAGSTLWLIDWEVAHRGDPTFDVAFLLHHLLLKAIKLPTAHAELADASEAFLSAYRAGTRAALPVLDPGYLSAQAGCLVLARVDGKSPAEYLDEDQRTSARALGISLLEEPTHTDTGLWARALEVQG